MAIIRAIEAISGQHCLILILATQHILACAWHKGEDFLLCSNEDTRESQLNLDDDWLGCAGPNLSLVLVWSMMWVISTCSSMINLLVTSTAKASVGIKLA